MVSADGGKIEALTTPDKTGREASHRLPQWLPDGKGLLFTIMKEPFDLQPQITVLDLKSRKWRVLIEDAADARDHERQNDGRTRELRRGCAGQNENSRSNDGADSQGNQVHRTESPLEHRLGLAEYLCALAVASRELALAQARKHLIEAHRDRFGQHRSQLYLWRNPLGHARA